jgi:hypothetical protein
MRKKYHDEKGASEGGWDDGSLITEARCRLLAWENVMKGLWVEAPNIAAFLAKGRCVMIDSATVVLGFPKDQAIARARTERVQAIVSFALSRMNGRDVLLKIITLE